MIFTSDALYRNTSNIWVYPDHIPATLIRYINVFLRTAENVYIQEVSCVAGELSVVLALQNGAIIASCKTKEPNTFVPMTINNIDICNFAYVYTGALVTDYSYTGTSNRPLLIGEAVTIAQNSSMSSIILEEESIVLDSDVNIVLDTMYYDGYVSDDGVLHIDWSDDGKALKNADPMYIDTVDCVQTINNIKPDKNGNINIDIVNATDTNKRVPITGTVVNDSASTAVCYINTDSSFVAMCTLDEPAYVANSFNDNTVNAVLRNCVTTDENTGSKMLDLEKAEADTYELTVSGGVSLYETNKECDALAPIKHELKCKEAAE